MENTSTTINNQSPLNADDVTIVIPTLNEGEAIGKVIDELRGKGYSNILVVDGYSDDGTAEIAGGKGVKVVYQYGRGKADALKTAVNHLKTPYLLVMDGDATYDPTFISELLKYASAYDEVIGARTYGRENIPLLNRFGNWVITKAFNLLFGTRLRDVCSGMYLLKTEVAREINYESRGFSIEVEVAAHVASTRRRITDVNIAYRPRVGKPKLKHLHGVVIMLDAVKLAWRYNPVFFIFICGSLILIPSTLILGWVAYKLFFLGIKHYVWAIIGTSGLGVGIVSLLLAVMALYIKRMEYRLLERIEKLSKKRSAEK